LKKFKLVKLSSNEDIIQTINSFIDALYLELSLEDKPGLITPSRQNKHSDMDFFIMFESVALIRKHLYGLMNICDDLFYFQEETVSGLNEKNLTSDFLLNYFFDNLKDDVERFVHFGLLIEKQMFSLTKGINTYKGIIFTYSILFISIYIFLEIYEYKIHDESENNFNITKYSIINIYSYIVQKVGQIFAEYKIKINNLPKSSYGAITYEKYNYRGVIDEAKDGYRIIFKALNYFLNLKNKNNIDSFLYNSKLFEEKRILLLKVFLFICSNLKDTNILGKKDEDILFQYQKLCLDILKIEDNITFFSQIEKINEFCIKNDISSGGSADLFSSTLALIKIFNLF